jgi:hypothetical protein
MTQYRVATQSRVDMLGKFTNPDTAISSVLGLNQADGFGLCIYSPHYWIWNHSNSDLGGIVRLFESCPLSEKKNTCARHHRGILWVCQSCHMSTFLVWRPSMVASPYIGCLAYNVIGVRLQWYRLNIVFCPCLSWGNRLKAADQA